MNRVMAGVLAGLLFTGATTQSLKAQFDLEGSLTAMYDDNINNNYLRIGDKISTFNLNTGYRVDVAGWETRLWYDGILNYYQSVLERTNQFHSANLNILHTTGNDQENTLNFAFTYGGGYYRDSYSFYDHSLFGASVGYNYALVGTVANKLGYTFRSVRFTELGDFSYTEHAVSTAFHAPLPTSTTVIAQADLGAKFYSTASPGSGSGSMRKGTGSIMPSVTQLAGFVRVGQSIVDGTGLSATVRYQWNIQKQTRYLSSSYGVISDDELFDDHYGYEGLQTSLMLTQVLSESMFLRIAGGLQNRSYSTLAAYDLGGTLIADSRVDRRSYVSVFLQKEFDLGFILKGAYDLIRNASNDKYFDYWNNAVTLELTVPF